MNAKLLKHVLLLTLLIISLLPQKSFAIDTIAKQIAAMEAILLELEVHYGMLKYKRYLFGVDYEYLRQKYTALIKKHPRHSISADSFRSLMIALIGEFQDGHLNMKKPSGDLYSLGLDISVIDGRIFVAAINEDLFNISNATVPVKIGDEVISLNGRPISEHIEEMLPYSRSRGGTYQRQFFAAARMLFNRHEMTMPRGVKEGELASLEFRRIDPRNREETLIKAKQRWFNVSDVTREAYFYLGNHPNGKKLPSNPPTYTYGMTSHPETQFSEGLKNLNLPPGSVTNIGDLLNLELEQKAVELEKKLPTLSSPQQAAGLLKKIEQLRMAKVVRLKAYTVQYKKKSFGVIRIPNYSPKSFQDVGREINWMAEAIARFNTTTDALIIDQNGNGGGYVHYAGHLLRLFGTEDGMIKGVKADIKLNETYLATVEKWLPKRDKTKKATTYDFPNTTFNDAYLSRKDLEKLKTLYKNGEQWSGPTSYMGVMQGLLFDEVGLSFRGNATPYKGQILFLNDVNSGSGGDFVPSLAQSNKQVTLFGEHSMGLGGPVYRQVVLPGSENWMRCTYAYCERWDGLPIENIGAVPQIFRPVSESDLRHRFAPYSHDVLEGLHLLIDGQTNDQVQAHLVELERKRAGIVQGRAQEFFAAEKALNDFSKKIKKHSQQKSAQKNLMTLFSKEMSKLENVISKVPLEQQKFLKLPVPAFLLRQDIILSSLMNSSSVADRLNIMKNLKRFKDSKTALGKLATVYAKYPLLRTTTTCADYYKFKGYDYESL